MDLVYDFLDNKIKLDSSKKVVVAVSSGPDSMCLLDILINMQIEKKFKIIVAHVNHNIRDESVVEEQFLKGYCESKNIIFEHIKINNYNHDNFHKYARNIRYSFFSDLVCKYDANYLMTAHHGDDLIETILMRLVRGSSLSGYKGFLVKTKVDNYEIIRPLVFVSKEEILEYNEKENIKYFIDNSNFKDKYTRNRYRKYILPVLKNESKNVHLKFLKFSNNLQEYERYILSIVDMKYDDLYKDEFLLISDFKKEDLLIRKLLIEKILSNLYQDLSVISDKHVNMILDFVNNNSFNKKLFLPNNINVVIEYGKLFFVNGNCDKIEYKYELKDGLLVDDVFCFKKYVKLDENGNDICHLSSKDLLLPLYVRNRKKGDRIELKGNIGSRKVKDIFIDYKVPKGKRDIWPIVVDSMDRIVWIPKLKKSKYDDQNNEKCDIIFKCL